MPRLLLLALVLLPLPALAGTATGTWLDATATVTAPDTAEPGLPFSVDVLGSVVGSSGSITSYALYEDATWAFDSNHMVQVTGGTLLDASGFHWGADYSASTTVDPGEGVHTYLFVYGQRSFGHGWYDAAAEVTVDVSSEPVLCDLAWLPPTGSVHPAGRTLPLKWTAAECGTGDFAADEGVVVTVYDAAGAVGGSWTSTGDPATGVDVGSLYHLNWATDRGDAGEWTIEVVFSTGEVLERTITLR